MVLACLFRFTLGFRRSYCKASLSFISEWTDLGTSSVRRGLEGLSSKGIIRQIESGTLQHGSAIYEVPIIAAYMLFSNFFDEPASTKTDTQPKPTPSVEEPGTQEVELCSTQAQNSAQNEHRSVPNLSSKKINTNKTLNKNIKTHTQTPDLPKSLEEYFSKIALKNKKAREWKHFQELQKNYTLRAIADAVEFLLAKGTPGKGEPCHSPLAFLSCAMDSVLSYLRAEREKQIRKQQHSRSIDEMRGQEAQQDAEQDSEFSQAVEAFSKAFPTEKLKEKQFDKFEKKCPFYTRGSQGFRAAAIADWYSNQNNHSNEF